MAEPTTDADGAEDTDAAAARARKEKIGRYVFAFLFPFVMTVMMVGGYLGAMHAPSPKDMPIAVTGPAATAQQVAGAIDAADPDAVDVRIVGDVDEARAAVDARDVAGAVALAPDGASATVYTASAAGASQASTVTSLVVPPLVAEGVDIAAEDLAPLPQHDPAGLAAMFMTTGLILAGYMPLSLALSNSPDLLRLRRFVPVLAGWAAVCSGVVWLIAGPVLGGIEGHGAAVFGIGWLAVFAVGMVQLLFTRFLGPLAVLLGMLLLMVLGVPASNLAMSIHTMPSFFGFLHGILPTPATGEALRSVLYFGSVGVGGHLVVLAVGALVGLAGTAAVDALRKRRKPDAAPPQVTMPSLTGSATAPRPAVRYAVLGMFPLTMVALMVALMTAGMYKPMPREVPVAVVATDQAQAEAAASGLDESMSGMFEFSATTSVDQARAAVAGRDVVAAYVLPSAESPSAELVTAGAAGMSQQQLVARTFDQVAQSQGVPLVTSDVAPLSGEDSMGTVAMYLGMGWIMAGFLLAMVLGNAAPDLIRLRRFAPIAVAWGIVMSAVVWLIAGPIVGAVSGHFLALWGIGALAIAAVALFSSVFVRLLGIIAVIPIITVLMFLGVPASGGGVSVYMIPELFRALHAVLPMPAAVESARAVLYFDGTGVGGHLVTFLIWGVVGIVGAAAIELYRSRRDRGEKEPELEIDTPQQEFDPVP